MNLFYIPILTQGLLTLDAEESRHAVRVLRLREGESISLTDGQGHLATGEVALASDRACTVSVNTIETLPPPPVSITLCVAPTKNPSRMEWLVEKAVEVGVETVQLLQCDHSERSFLKTDRLQKLALSAMKQSLQTRLPRIESPLSLRQYLSAPCEGLGLIAHCDDSSLRTPIHQVLRQREGRTAAISILIGPEGDFSAEEVKLALEAGYHPVALGPTRLRTETAALYALVAARLSLGGI